jgi:mRNA-degrading endonuclease toxin of MazEF toxin-antitoxin module
LKQILQDLESGKTILADVPTPRPADGHLLIYLLNLPGQAKDTKSRPALVVSLDVRNRLANDVVVIPISTSLRSSPTHVELIAGEGGLEKRSMAKCEQITTAF